MIETFWSWMVAKSGRKTGFRLLITPWLLLDATVAAFLVEFLQIDGFAFAERALFPAASILVSVAVAWTARASFIISDDDFREKVIASDNPIEDYVYGYQLSILVLFSAIIYVAIMSSGGFNFYIHDRELSKFVSSFFMFLLLSLTLRECWSVINFTNLLSLLNAKVSEPRG